MNAVPARTTRPIRGSRSLGAGLIDQDRRGPAWKLRVFVLTTVIGILPALCLSSPAGASGPATIEPPSIREPVLGEPAEGVLEELAFLREESVGIAARHEQPISEAPSNVYVITDEDIKQSGATDLPTILRRIPGMEVMQTNGAEFNVSVRGNNQLVSNKLLVLVDGRSIYVDAQTAVIWKLLPVTLPEIKRIEVLKGPASALYGFNAFDGIINIITKSPGEMKEAVLQFGGGEFGTLTGSAVQAGSVGRFGYRLSAGMDQNNQWDNRDALAFRAYKFNLHTQYRLPREARLDIAGGLVDSNRFVGQIQTGNRTLSMTPGQGYARAAFEQGQFFLRGFWNRFFDTSEITQDPPLTSFITITDLTGNSISKTRSDTYDIEAQHATEFTLRGRHRLTYGVNYRHTTLSNNFIEQFSREDRLGLYVQEEWTPTDPLTLIAGLRLDLHSEINPTYSPRGAFVYRLAPDHTIRGAISVAYRPPTLFETNLASVATLALPPLTPPFCPVPFPCTFPNAAEGSNNLDPEQIISYDLGYQGWFFRHRLRLRADLFFNHVSDLIRFSRSGDLPPVTFFPVNGGGGDVYGGEVGIEFLATPWLSGFVNYAYQDNGSTFRSATKPIVPQNKVNAGLRVDFANGLNGQAVLHYVGSYDFSSSGFFDSLEPLLIPGTPPSDQRVDSYALLNLRAGYRFWQDTAEVAVSAFNTLNDRHKEFPRGETIRNRVMGWLTIRL